jgi:hypothetical protein
MLVQPDTKGPGLDDDYRIPAFRIATIALTSGLHN